MKFSALLLSSLATGSIAVSIPRLDLTISNAAQRVFDGFGEDREEASSERFFVELGPGEQRWITEEEKWALKRVSPEPPFQLPKHNGSPTVLERHKLHGHHRVP